MQQGVNCDKCERYATMWTTIGVGLRHCPWLSAARDMMGPLGNDSPVIDKCTMYKQEGDELWNRRTPEPMTSVVRWVRFSSDAADFSNVLVSRKASRAVRMASLEYDGIDKVHYWHFGRGEDFVALKDDLWAEIPQPPEEQG